MSVSTFLHGHVEQINCYLSFLFHGIKIQCKRAVVTKTSVTGNLVAGVGNCFGMRAASRSRKLAEGRTF